MNKSPLRNLAIMAVTLASLTAIGVYFYQKSQSNQPQKTYGISLRQELVRPDSYAKGPANAPLTIVEFLDPECEACKAFYPTLKKFLEANKDNVRLVVRYMAFHGSSAMAIAAVESAGLQNKYWEYLDILFATAEEWGHKQSPDATYFEKYAKSIGLNLEKFKSDMADPRWQTLIQRDMADGKVMGVQGTPTVFLNGDTLKGLDYSSLVNAARPHIGILVR